MIAQPQTSRRVDQNFLELPSLLKNSLYARFGPRMGPKNTVCGASWSFWSPIRSHCELSADFLNKLMNSANFRFRGSAHQRPIVSHGCHHLIDGRARRLRVVLLVQQ